MVRKFRRLVTGPSVAALIVIAAAWLHSPVSALVEKQIRLAQSELLSSVQDLIGATIRFEAVEASFLHILDVRGLYLDFGGEGWVRINRFQVRYDLIRLVLGGTSVVRELAVENAEARVRASLFERLSSLWRNDGSAGYGGVRIPRLVGKNIAAEVTGPGARVAVSGLSFQINPEDDAMGVRIRSRIQAESADLAALGEVDALVSVVGSASSGLDRFSMVAELRRVSTDLFRLSDVGFQVNLDKNRLSLVKVRDRLPYDLSMEFLTDDREARLSLVAAGLRPASVIDTKPAGNGLEAWLSSTEVSGGLDLRYFAENDRLEYQGDLELVSDHPLLRGRTMASARFSGSERMMDFSELALKSDRGNAAFEGSIDIPRRLPDGVLTLDGLREPLTDTAVDGAIRLEPKGSDLALRSDRLRVGGVSVYRPTFLVTRKAAFAEIRGQAFADAEGREEISVNLRIDDRSAAGEVRLLAVQLASLYPILERVNPEGTKVLPRPASGLVCTAVVVLDLEAGRSAVEVPILTISEIDRPDRRLWLRGNGDREGFVIDTFYFSLGSDEGEGRFAGRFEAGGGLVLDAEFSFQDVPYSFQAMVSPEGTIELRGDNGFTAELLWQPGGEARVRAAGREVPVPLGGRTVLAGFVLDASYGGPGDWLARITKLELSDVDFGNGISADVALAGEVSPGAAVFSSLSYDDGYSRLEGEARAAWLDGLVTVGGGLRNLERGESYDLRGEYREGEVIVSIASRNFVLDRLQIPGLRGTAGGNLTARRGSRGEVSFEGDFATEATTLNRDPIVVSASVEAAGGIVRVSDLNLLYFGNRVEDGRIELNLAAGQVAAGLPLTTGPAGPKTQVMVEVTADFDPNHESLLGAVAGNLDAEVRLVGAPFKDFPSRMVRLEIQRREGRTRIVGTPNRLVAGEILDDGRFSLEFGSPIPVSARLSGKLTGTRIDAVLDDIRFQVADIKDQLALDVFHPVSGDASGRIRIEGQANDPDFFGRIRIERPIASLDIMTGRIEGPPVDLLFDGKVLKFGPVLATTESGNASVSGDFVMGHWAVRSSAIRVDNARGNPRHGPVRITADFGTVSVDGFGEGVVTIVSDERQVRVEGDLLVTDTDITLGTASETAPPQGDFGVSIDLTFTSGSGVAFTWPSRNFPVLRSFAARGEKLRLQADSATDAFLLVGDIRIGGGRIFYFDRSFYVREGSIRFNERGNVFDPILTARAETREPTPNGTARIYLIADNTRLSRFSPRFESDSALTSSEIVGILGRGILPGNGQGSVGLTQAVLLTGDVVGQFGVIHAFEEAVRSRLNVDVFSVRTHVLQNLLLEAIDENQAPLDTRVPSLGKYLDKTSVFLGKYLGNDLFFEFLLQFQAIDPVERQLRDFGGIQVDSEFLLEWRTPFFLLEWSFFPRNWEELFIPDNKLSFSWQLSF